MGTVNVQNDAGTVHRFCKDLTPQQNGLKSLWPGVPSFPGVPRFWTPVTDYQPWGFSPSPGRRPAGHSGLAWSPFSLDAPYACQTPGHPGGQASATPIILLAGEAEYRDLRGWAPGACIDSGIRNANRQDQVVGQQHGAQGPIVGGEVRVGGEVHAVWGGTWEARSQAQATLLYSF